MTFQLSEADKRLSALDVANVQNPTPQNSAALDAELTRQQPFQLTDADRRLSALDVANIRNPSVQNSNALNAELSRQQPSSGGVPVTAPQQDYLNTLQRFSQGTVNFFTGNTPGGGAPEAIRTDVPNAVSTRFKQAQGAVQQFGDDNAIGSPNVDFNAGRDYSINYLQRPDGTRAYTQEDTAPGALGDSERNYAGRTATEEFAEASRIRGETRAAQEKANDKGPFNQITILGEGDQGPTIQERQLKLIDALGSSTGDYREKNRIYRQLQALDDVARVDNTSEIAQNRQATDLAIQQRQAAAQTERGRASNLAQLANAAKVLDELGRSGQQLTPIQQEAVKAATAQWELGGADPGQLNAQIGQYGLPPLFVEGMADGGLVEPTNQRTMGTGAVGSFGAMGGKQESMQRYQQYAAKAQEMNLPLLSFNEFSTMTSEPKGYANGGMVQGPDAMGGVLGYAEGGMVDVSGAQVIDNDPNAPTDSIPAVIDGQRPAALDSGEFVIPKDVVMYYGTDKLSKMIEKARNPDGGKQQQSTALGGAAAS